VRSTTPRPRRPAGVPTGGQYAPKTQPEPGYSLEAEPAEPEPKKKRTGPSPLAVARQRHQAARNAWRNDPDNPVLREAAASTASAWALLWGQSHRRQLAYVGLTPEDLAGEAAAQALASASTNPHDVLRACHPSSPHRARHVAQMGIIIQKHPAADAAEAALIWWERYGGTRPVSAEELQDAWREAKASLTSELPVELSDDVDPFASVDERLDAEAGRGEDPPGAAARRVTENVRGLLAAETAAASKPRDRRRATSKLAILDAILKDPHITDVDLGERIGADRATAKRWPAGVKALFMQVAPEEIQH